MRHVSAKGFIVYFSCWLIVIGCVPADGLAMLAPSASDLAAVPLSPRSADLELIQAQLESKLVTQRLSDVGLTPSDIQDRLAGLSNEQLHQVAQNIDGLQTGGELILILAIIGAIVVVLALIGLARQA